MKYCKSCKSLFHVTEMRCPECGKKLSDITDVNEPIRLCIIGGTERALLCGLLEDAGIPFLENNTFPQGVANEIVTGYDVKLSNVSVLVPFSALPKASELLNSLETVKNPIEPMMPGILSNIVRLNEEKNEAKSMSPAMRTTIKVVSAIAFLIIVALVVFGTDKIMEFIKGLFGGN